MKIETVGAEIELIEPTAPAGEPVIPTHVLIDGQSYYTSAARPPQVHWYDGEKFPEVTITFIPSRLVIGNGE